MSSKISPINEASKSHIKTLANKKDISPDTRKLVQTLAKKLHYYPNPLAYALRQYGKYVSA